MDQTTIKQFFVARKSSLSSSLPPSKRIKLDGEKLEKNITREKPRKQCLRKGAKQSKSKDASSKTTKKVTFFVQNELRKENETSSIAGKANKIKSSLAAVDEHGGKPRINPSSILSLPKPQLMAAGENFLQDTGDSAEQLPTNDQLSKSILLSRGSQILKAGYDRNLIKSPSKASEILSPQKNNTSGVIIGSPSRVRSTLMSPTKLSHVLKALTPQKEVLKSDERQGKRSPGAQDLDQQKLSHAESATNPRRQRLRNKFKHLLQSEETECHVTAAPISDATTTTCVTPEKIFKERSHKKFNYLTQKTVSSGFILPQKFKILIEMFRCVDSILYLLNQRSEVCTFDKLKKSVETMCSRSFEMEHLAKIKTVYPNGFTFRQEKGLRTTQGISKSYQLSIEANFKESVVTGSKQITSNVLITRRLKFENLLLDIVKAQHENFLHTLDMKIDNSQIHRWHPHFKLDEVPDIESSSLPHPPVTKDFNSAADLIRNSNGNLSTKVHNVLCNIANKDIAQKNNVNNISENNESRKSIVDMPGKNTSSNTKLKGVSLSILDRIRQKEQNKIQLAMTRDPETEEKLSKMQRLPEICRILKSYFTTEKKAAITLEDCAQKLMQSYGSSINQVYLEEHIRLLSKLVPEWLTIAVVRKFPYVKLSKVYDINKVLATLDRSKKNISEA